MRRFSLIRHEDEVGVSGTGHVADGVVFEDGTAVLHWRTKTVSTVVYRSIQDVRAVHGHDGQTTVQWDDDINEDCLHQWREVAADLLGGDWTCEKHGAGPHADLCAQVEIGRRLGRGEAVTGEEQRDGGSMSERTKCPKCGCLVYEKALMGHRAHECG